jgi:hypothetical protein
LEVSVTRTGGFSGEIQLRVDGLPETVDVQDSIIGEGKSSSTVKLTASDDTVLGDTVLRITGVATIAGQEVERTLYARHLGADSEGYCLGPRTLAQLNLTVNHKQPFRLFCSEAYQYAHRGSVFMYPMEVERLHGFVGPITLQIGDRQNRDLDGIEMFEVTIPADANHVALPIYLPETMHINIQSQSQLYAQGYAEFRDQHGQQQATLVLAEKRNMLRTLPPVVKLQARDEQLELDPGETGLVRLLLERTKNFDGPMQLVLLGDSPAGLTVGRAEIPAGESEAAISVTAGPDWQTATACALRFRATGWMGDTQLISESAITIQPRSLVGAR